VGESGALNGLEARLQREILYPFGLEAVVNRRAGLFFAVWPFNVSPSSP
jgi:hypothetical protein